MKVSEDHELELGGNDPKTFALLGTSFWPRIHSALMGVFSVDKNVKEQRIRAVLCVKRDPSDSVFFQERDQKNRQLKRIKGSGFDRDSF